MATISPDVFQKFQNAKKLPVRQQGDGHELEVDIREDEEQSVKLQEIIDLLVAAGYFRARIKGLSPFDKVVGGMTWCIESCNVDVDVDLLFQENSTIGQKIALTEKIVAVLPKMNCPHRIEPHQIQGLDFIHIFPVIQWLVKRSMEFRQETAHSVRKYAVNQFNKHFGSEKKETEVQKKMFDNLKTVNEVYRPHRYYKRKTAPPPDLESRVQITLLEYGHRAGESSKGNSSTSSGTDLEHQKSEEPGLQELYNNLAIAKEDILDYKDLNEEERQDLAKHYAALHSELKDGGEQAKEEEQLLQLKDQLKILEEGCVKLESMKKQLEDEIEADKKCLEEVQSQRKENESALKEYEELEAKDFKKCNEIKELVILSDTLKTQESQFKEHCKQELARLEKQIEDVKKLEKPIEVDPEIEKRILEETDINKKLRLQLAKKNRLVATLQRQLDDVPNRAELTQYQRRFLELYNQVAAKHKETKQYYTLYNTLQDTRTYMKKELSLLNSIAENYPEAMQSNAGKEEFLKQLQNIVEGVRQTRLKVEHKVLEEKKKRDEISQTLQSYVELQRKYVAALRQLSIECKRYEHMVAQGQK